MISTELGDPLASSQKLSRNTMNERRRSSNLENFQHLAEPRGGGRLSSRSNQRLGTEKNLLRDNSIYSKILSKNGASTVARAQINLDAKKRVGSSTSQDHLRQQSLNDRLS